MITTIFYWYLIIGLVAGVGIYLTAVVEDIQIKFGYKRKGIKYTGNYKDPFILLFSAAAAIPILNLYFLFGFILRRKQRKGE